MENAFQKSSAQPLCLTLYLAIGLAREGNPIRSVLNDVVYFLCLRAWCKYKALKVKHANKPQKTSKRCFEKKMHNKTNEKEMNGNEVMFVTSVKNRMNEMQYM